MRKRRRFRVLLAFLLVMSLVGSGTTPAMVSAEEIVHDHEHEEVLEAPEVQEPEVHVHEWSVEYAQDDASHWRTCIGCGTGEEPAGHSWLDGACTVCGRSCTHNWSNLNGVCAVCGYQCTHDWSNLNGVCAVCQYPCVHDWSNANGVCAVCQYPCVHDWSNANGVCAVCQYPCVHDWSNANGVCAVCQYACVHSWNEGVCSVCGTVCGHAWDGNVCTVCGSEAPQDDQSGQDAGNDGTGNMDTGDVDTGEEDGDADDDSIAEITPDPDDTNEPEPSGQDDLDTEEPSIQNGAETENEPVPSLASNGDVSLLSEECEHVWASWWSADDTSHWHECQYCDARTDEGAHDWVERSDENSHWEECTGCGAHKDGTSYGHYWNEGVCEICGYICEHDGYSIGECFICGMYLGEHTHTFDWNWEYDNEYHWHSCFYCDEIINYRGHDWANGVCKTCGYACMHDYKYSGICKNCGMDRAEAHEYYWDIYTTGHQWYCRDCNQSGYWEEHDWNEAGICAVCGYQCGHDGEETGTCDTCGKVLEGHDHSACDYDYDSTEHWKTCSSCMQEFVRAKHSWENGRCTVCDYECYHDGEYAGICETCGKNLDEIEHTVVQRYNQYYHWFECQDCGLNMSDNEYHIWTAEDGICTICGYQCGHDGLVEGVCETCGKTLNGHDHSVTNTSWDWDGDENNHWRACSCGERLFEEAHDWEGSQCTVCNYWCDHIIGEKWISDGSGHWKECPCGEQYNFRPHDWSNGDGICADCGYQPENCDHGRLTAGICTGCGTFLSDDYEHRVDDGWYNWDEYEHWQNCYDCGEKVNVSAHDWDEEGYCPTCDYWCSHNGQERGNCSICGVFLGCITHSYSDEWSSDADCHWHACTVCGEWNNQISHFWINGRCEECRYVCQHNGVDRGTCPICDTYLGAHTHTFSWEWSGDYDSHWHSCLYCGETLNRGPHDWSNGDGICADCGATCYHDWEETGICDICGLDLDTYHNWKWSFDETEHWQICIDCDEGTEGYDHNWSNQDGICTECGYHCGHEGATEGTCAICGKDVQGHDHSYTTWSSGSGWDDQNHWYECDYCDEIALIGAHEWKDGMCTLCRRICQHNGNWTGICDICGENLDVDHDFSWRYDEYNHWKFCPDCGVESNRMSHDWSGKDGICTDCGYQCGHDGDETGTCWTCGKTLSGHDHSYSYYGEWDMEKDESGHWFACEFCDEKLAFEVHDWSEQDGFCAFCGYECEEHTFGDEWVSDESGHWHACACGEKTDFHYHDWDDGTGICADCGYQVTDCGHNGLTAGICMACGSFLGDDYEHRVSEDEWDYDYDATNHWRTCLDCGEMVPSTVEKHDWNESGWCGTCSYSCGHNGQKTGTCDICGKYLGCVTHVYSEEWSYSPFEHYHACIYGDDIKDYGTHIWDKDGKGSCTVCGYVCSHMGQEIGICKRCGKYLSEHTHSYSWYFYLDETQHWHECRYCDERWGAEDHTWVDGICEICAWNCSHDGKTMGTCDICGEYLGKVHDHDYQWGYDVYGWHYRVCTVCGDTQNHEMHSWDGTTGICAVCGFACGHGGAESGVCNTCGKTVDGHQHAPEAEDHNKTHHWQWCVCGEKLNEEAHDWSRADGACTGCGYTCLHTGVWGGICDICGKNLDADDGHSYGVRYDEDSHWLICEADDYCIKQPICDTEHDWDSVEGVCTVCGYQCGHLGKTDGVCSICGQTIEGHEHSYIMDGSWWTNENVHYLECDHCDEVMYEEPHDWKNGYCRICGYSCDDHEYSTEWSGDSSEHWHECFCGRKTDEAEHEWDADTGICTVCDYTCTHNGFTVGVCAECGKYLGESREDISKATVTLSSTSLTCTGKELKPSVTVKYGTKTLKEGTDYTLSYSNNINPGTGKVTVTGMGNYSGTKSATFTIKLATPKLGAATAEASNAIKVTWSAVPGAEKYILYYKTPSKSDWVRVVQDGVTGISYTHTITEVGVKHTYTVRAVYGSTLSSFDSAGVSATTALDTVKLGSAAANSQSKITVTWNSVPGAQGYRIYRKSGGSDWVGQANLSGTTLSYADTGLAANTKYTYTVRAYVMVNGKQVLSPDYSRTGVSATTSTATVKLGSAKANNAKQVTVTWSAAAGADGYRIYRKSGGSDWVGLENVSASARSYVDTTVLPGIKYTYTVRGYITENSTNILGGYNTTGVSVTTSVGRTTLGSATANSAKQVTVTWKAVPGADGYRVYRKSGGSDWVGQKNVSASTLSYVDTSVTNGTKYTYTVRAYVTVNGTNVLGSYNTTGVSATPAVGKVTLGTATPNSAKQITVTWKAVSGADGYRVYRKSGNSDWVGQKNVSADTLSYVDTNVSNGVKYTYTVRAYETIKGSNVLGSYDTKGVSATPAVGKVELGDIKADSSNQVTLTWEAVPGADGYRVYRKSGGSDWVGQKNVSADTLSYVDTSVTKGVKYTYTVRAYETIKGNNVLGSYDTKGLSITP